MHNDSITPLESLSTCPPGPSGFHSFRFESDDGERDTYVSWRGDRFLRRLALDGIPALVIGEPGGGRSTAVWLAEFDDGDYAGGVTVLAGLRSQEDLEEEIFVDCLDRSSKSEREWGRGIWVSGSGDGKCGFCARHCPLSAYDPWIRTIGDLFLAVVGRAKGACPLRLELGTENLVQQGLPIIMDVPPDVPSVVQVAARLLGARVVTVLVAELSVARRLQCEPNIAALPKIPFPAMDDSTLLRIATARGATTADLPLER